MPQPDIKFCRLCGASTERRIPEGEDRERPVCRACGYVDYVNPTIVVGTVPIWEPSAATTGAHDEARVLLCLRAIEPRKGYWTLPAGFLEYGETLDDGAARETREEAGARFELNGLFTVLDVVHAGQVHVFYRANLVSPDLDPGPETAEAQLVPLSEIPWDDLAFATVHWTLERYLEDRARGQAGVHTASIPPHRH